MSIKKNFSAPWALGLGATRRAAMLLLVMMLMMAQTAWAGTTIETRIVTWKMDGGLSGQTTQTTTGTLYTTVDGANQSMVYTNSENHGFSLDHFGDFGITETNGNLSTNNGYISFPGIKGTVTKVEMVNFSFARTGLQMYVGKDRSNTSTLLHLQGNDSDFDFAADNSEDSYNKSATFVGSVAVNESTPLKIMFAQTSGGEIYSTTFAFNKGYIKVTYDTEVETTDDPGHNFTSITTSGNTLTATCTQSDPYHQCGLTNRQATLTLSIDDAPYDFVNHTASLNMQEFTSSTSLAVSSVSIVYTNKVTGVERTQGEYEIGSYTATATVTIGGAEYTLNKDFEIYNGTIACDYPQFSISPIPAIAGNDVTITYTPLAGETVTSLTLTGAKANMSLGNGITDKHDGTYTFTMVSESLTLGATFSEPDASHFEQTGTDEYTIKTANGWNWFCYALNSGLVADGFSGKTVKLGTSVGSSEMAGTSGHPFKGTFDGQGNTLTFNLQASEGNSAPFHYTDGATISNLHVEGTITGGTYESLGGLVGRAEGNITIENCHVSTQISTTHSGAAWHGGVIAEWNGTNATCTVTGCVYDGLIYNPNEAGVTTSCRGFIGWDYGNNGTITFTDCLSAPAAYGTGKYALGDNCFTFVYPNSEPTLTYHMTNCYYTSILGNRQGRPAATATVAPANLGNATTDHGMVDGYENGFLYDGNYYTPKYGDAVVEYRYDDWNERADVTLSDRTLYKDGNWNTLCLPFSLSAAQIAANANFAGATLMTMDVTEKNGFDVEDGTLYLWFKTATEIEAGVPYLVKWDKAADYDNNPSVYDIVSPVFEGVTISNSTAQTVESSTEGLETVQMVGTYSPVGVTADDKSILFLGDANTLYYSTVDRQIRSYRAYFSVPYINGHAEAKARAFALSFDGEETTGILGVSANYNGVTDEAWYSLDGVRLSGKPTQRGLYINNGKKVVIK